jgi:hypothetical protein
MMRSRNLGIFVRSGKGRFPIGQRFGSGVGGLCGRNKRMDNAEATTASSFAFEFPRQTNLFLAGKR